MIIVDILATSMCAELPAGMPEWFCMSIFSGYGNVLNRLNDTLGARAANLFKGWPKTSEGARSCWNVRASRCNWAPDFVESSEECIYAATSRQMWRRPRMCAAPGRSWFPWSALPACVTSRQSHVVNIGSKLYCGVLACASHAQSNETQICIYICVYIYLYI